SYLAGSKALGELALILAKTKERRAQAGEIALQGLKVAESVSSCSDDRCHALEDIAEVLLTLGKAPEAHTATRHVWALWKREKEKIYTEPVVHLQAIATLFAKLGQNKEAQEVAEMHLKLAKAAPHSGELPFAVETFAKIGRLEDARKIAERIPDSWERQEALKNITEFGG
ncbi:MAG: hypothetical protein NTX57_01550, partial [Armatimonadetes bacterium]|nr:hypothetical protein [Armatimonadota bacterium]